jgi:hypothetical protein
MPTAQRQQWRRLQPRHVIVGLCFLATFTAYVERVGFSIAFTSLARQVGFDEQVKGGVMSAFYWGYGVSQVRVWAGGSQAGKKAGAAAAANDAHAAPLASSCARQPPKKPNHNRSPAAGPRSCTAGARRSWARSWPGRS